MSAFYAVLLVALAGCTVLAARRGRSVLTEEAMGFAYVGAGGLAVLAVAVVVVGLLSDVPGRAEGLALLVLAAYVVYLLAAWLVIRFVHLDR